MRIQRALLIVACAGACTGCFVDRSGALGADRDAGDRPDAFVEVDGGAVDSGPPPPDGGPPPDAPLPQDGGPECVATGPEVCDSAMVDEDCDEMVNPGCVCFVDMPRPCTHATSGCGGTEACLGTAWSGVCIPTTAASQTCNGMDDDCDGTIDEDSGCAGGGCSFFTRTTASSTSSYLFCATTEEWGAAQSACEGRGYDLVTINDGPENTALLAWANSLSGGNDRWWIGYNDADGDGSYSWVGESTAYRFTGAPSNRGECAVLDASADDWGGDDCEGTTQWSRYFICEAKRVF